MLSSARCITMFAAIVALAACDGSGAGPTAPSGPGAGPTQPVSSTAAGSERLLEESLYDMSDSYVELTCEDGQPGELIALHGQLYERFTVLYTAAGGFHVGYHTMPVGLGGTGTVSGEEFRVKEQDHGSYNQTLMGATGAYRQVFSFVGRTSGRSFKMSVRGRYTVNANGELTVSRDKAVLVCEN